MAVPPFESPQDKSSTAASRGVAHLLDTLITIPGTKFKIGLDPIIGLIPGVGDAVASVMGGVILADALRRGVPNTIMARMAGNMLVNASLGSIPVIGDLFSAWFKSNTKNHEILRAWVLGHPTPPVSSQSKWLVLWIIVFLFAIVGFTVLAFWLAAQLWKAVS